MIIHPDFLDHWKTTMFTEQLQDEAAPLYLIRLWAHCQNSKRASFERLPKTAVKAICRYPGDANDLDAALSDCGWIVRTGDSVEVLGWEEHNAQLIANWENGRKGGRPRKSRNPRDTHGIPTDNPPITHGIPTDNPTRTDKRREGKNRLDKTRKEGVEPAPLPSNIPQDIWNDWLEYREQMHPPLNDSMIKAQFKQLEGLTQDEVRNVITYSLAGGYKNLFTDRVHGERRFNDDWTNPKPRSEPEYDADMYVSHEHMVLAKKQNKTPEEEERLREIVLKSFERVSVGAANRR